MTATETPNERIQKYLRQLTPQARVHLLREMERLEQYDEALPGSEAILAELRAEFRKSGENHARIGNPSRYFFQPLEPVLVDIAPERANCGQISRGSLWPIWEWMSRDLLPTMAEDYAQQMKRAIAGGKTLDAEKLARAFQSKVAAYVDGALASDGGAGRIRAGLGVYTSASGTFDDLIKLLCVLRARDALAAFGAALPQRIVRFDGNAVETMRGRLDALAAANAAAVPFALTMLAGRLVTPWQLIRLATKVVEGKDPDAIAAAPYGIAVSMALDQIEDRRLALRQALKTNRLVDAGDTLADIYDIEFALRVRIDLRPETGLGQRLAALMEAVEAIVAAEAACLPGDTRHVLRSRRLRRHELLAGRLTYVAWKGRDAVSGAQAFCRRLIQRPQSAHG